jgi:hypothetical protein
MGSAVTVFAIVAGLMLGPCIIAFTAGLAEVWQGRQAAASQEGDA